MWSRDGSTAALAGVRRAAGGERDSHRGELPRTASGTPMWRRVQIWKKCHFNYGKCHFNGASQGVTEALSPKRNSFKRAGERVSTEPGARSSHLRVQSGATEMSWQRPLDRDRHRHRDRDRTHIHGTGSRSVLLAKAADKLTGSALGPPGASADYPAQSVPVRVKGICGAVSRALTGRRRLKPVRASLASFPWLSAAPDKKKEKTRSDK